jgi:hypothetical protein
VVLAAGDATLEFDRVFVFRRRGHDRYDVEAGRLRVVLHDARGFELDGGFDSSSWISDSEIRIGEDDVEKTELLAGTRGGTVKIVFTNGVTLRAKFERAEAELLGPFEKVEVWEGPL